MASPTIDCPPPSSNGQDAALSRPKSEFDSPWRHYRIAARNPPSNVPRGQRGGNTPPAKGLTVGFNPPVA